MPKKPDGSKGAGRPSSYSAELAERICAEMLERDEKDKTRSLRDVCNLDGMPSESAVYSWLAKHEEFADMYARTRETLADMNANDIVKIADDATDANLARVRIDARKWWAAKVAPKKYGDRPPVDGDTEAAINNALLKSYNNAAGLIAAILDSQRRAGNPVDMGELISLATDKPQTNGVKRPNGNGKA